MLEIILVLLLLLVAIVLFARETLSVDLITLLLLICLVAFRILTPAEAFSGFSSDIIIILGSIFVLNGALQETGILDALSRQIIRFASRTVSGMNLTLMSVVGALSAFMNNTAATALFLNPVIAMARKAKISPSKLLLPLCYASILGGTCTLIGTSTNVAVSGFIARQGMEPLGLFELTPVGLIVLVVGILYMMFIGNRLLPDYPDEQLRQKFSMREYLSEIVVVPGSPLIGHRVEDSSLSQMGFQFLLVIRGEERFFPSGSTVLQAGDLLLVEGTVDELMQVKEAGGIEIHPQVQQRDLQSNQFRIAEMLIPPTSDLSRRTLREAEFRQRFGLTVLAISRQGRTLREQLGEIRLRVGDILLVQGPADRFDYLQHHPDLSLLEEQSATPLPSRKGWLVIAFFSAAVAAGGFGIAQLPLSIYFLIAAVMVVLFRCISVERAYEYIDWRLLILIGGMTAFGAAMEKTGAARFLAEGVVGLMQPLGVMAILAAFAALTILLTQPMSNAAAALVVLPVALETASQLGVNERTFAIGIMLSASVSFIAPFEPSAILVYGPGKYRFSDFIRVGSGLTILLFLVIIFLIPRIWPLQAVPG